MRIPIGILTERYGGRRVFTVLMVYSVIPLVLLALFHDSFTSVVVLGFLLGVTGASFAIDRQTASSAPSRSLAARSQARHSSAHRRQCSW